MAINSGAFPIDPADPVGLFRFEVGDVVAVANDPADGLGTFEFMSDDTISSLLGAYPDRDTAKAVALTSMATQLITSAQDIQVDDIRIKTVERANLMLTLARGYNDGATIGAAAAAFQVVSLQSTMGVTHRTPQGIPFQYGESGF